jgi:hypothetical protein
VRGEAVAELAQVEVLHEPVGQGGDVFHVLRHRLDARWRRR